MADFDREFLKVFWRTIPLFASFAFLELHIGPPKSNRTIMVYFGQEWDAIFPHHFQYLRHSFYYQLRLLECGQFVGFC